MDVNRYRIGIPQNLLWCIIQFSDLVVIHREGGGVETSFKFQLEQSPSDSPSLYPATQTVSYRFFRISTSLQTLITLSDKMLICTFTKALSDMLVSRESKGQRDFFALGVRPKSVRSKNGLRLQFSLGGRLRPALTPVFGLANILQLRTKNSQVRHNTI